MQRCVQTSCTQRFVCLGNRIKKDIFHVSAGPAVCIDDDGNERKVRKPATAAAHYQRVSQPFMCSVNVFQPGDTWLLEDGCHSVLCHPSGAVTVQTRKVSCDTQELPSCSNNMPPVRVQDTCNCRWECPCKYVTRFTQVLSSVPTWVGNKEPFASCSYLWHLHL